MLLIKDVGWLYDGHGGPPQRGRSLLADAGRIVAVGSTTELAPRVRAWDTREIDARGMTLIPGLVDGHVHLALAPGRRALADVATVPAEDLAARAILNAQRCLAAGTTTLRDCGAPGAVGLALARVAHDAVPALPRIQTSGPCLTTTGGHGESIGIVADSAMELRRWVRRLCRDGADFIKIMATGGSTDPHTNRGRAQYSQRELRIAIADAHRLGRQVVCHANGTEGIANAVRAGVDVVAHCNWLAADGQRIERHEALADEMVAANTAIDLNVNGALAEADDPDGRVVTRWELLRPLMARGLPVFLSSDGFGADAARFGHKLAAAAKLLGIPARELVQRVTTIPSAVVGSSATADGLRPGARCDAVLLDGDLEQDRSTLTRPSLVIVDGAIAVRNGALVLPEETKA